MLQKFRHTELLHFIEYIFLYLTQNINPSDIVVLSYFLFFYLNLVCLADSRYFINVLSLMVFCSAVKCNYFLSELIFQYE